MHKKKKSLLLMGLLVAAGIICGMAVLMSDRIFVASSEIRNPCQDVTGYTIYKVSVKDGKIMPAAVQAHICDRMIVTNYDDTLRVMVYSDDENNNPDIEHTLTLNKNFTVTFERTGSYTLGDKAQKLMGVKVQVSDRAD